jgi:hypothetical protein
LDVGKGNPKEDLTTLLVFEMMSTYMVVG